MAGSMRLTNQDIQRYAVLPDEVKRRCREIMVTEGLTMGKAAIKAEKEWTDRLQEIMKDIIRTNEEMSGEQ